MVETIKPNSLEGFKNEFKKEMRIGVAKTSFATLFGVLSIKGMMVANQLGQNFDAAHDAVKSKIYDVILTGLLRKDPGMTAAANQITGNSVGTQTIWDPVNNATIVAKNALDHVMTNLQQASSSDNGYPRTMTDFSSNPAYQYIWSKAHDLIVQYASMDNSATIQLAMVSVAGIGMSIVLFAWAKSSHNFGKAMDALKKAREYIGSF